MPKIAIYKFLTFYIVSYDMVNEPPHLHVIKSKKGYKKSAKIWLESIEFSEISDFTEKELNLVAKLVKRNQQSLIEAFYKYKENKEFKPVKLKLK